MQSKDVKTAIVTRLQWHPRPIQEPAIDAHLTRRSAIERSSEVLTFWLLRLEWWLSPGGSLREWIRLNFYAGIFFGILTFIVVPIITILLNEFVTWTALLATIVKNLVVAQCLGLVAIAILVGIYIAARMVLSRK